METITYEDGIKEIEELKVAYENLPKEVSDVTTGKINLRKVLLLPGKVKDLGKRETKLADKLIGSFPDKDSAERIEFRRLWADVGVSANLAKAKIIDIRNHLWGEDPDVTKILEEDQQRRERDAQLNGASIPVFTGEESQ